MGLIEDAARAQELFSADELEAHAAKLAIAQRSGDMEKLRAGREEWAEKMSRLGRSALGDTYFSWARVNAWVENGTQGIIEFELRWARAHRAAFRREE